MTKEDLDSAFKEAALLFELNHKHIVRYKDFYMDEKRVYILTERMDMSL